MNRKYMALIVTLALLVAPGTVFAGTTTDDIFIANDRIGLRIANPLQVLHLFTATTGTTRFRLEQNEGFVDLIADNNGFQILNNGSTNLTLNQFGNLGLGTTSPSQRMHLKSNTAGSTRFRMEQNEGFVDMMTDNGGMQIQTGGVGRLWIQLNGNVGIGTGAPGALLDVAGTGRVEILEITGGSDLSEQFEVNSNATLTEAGSVVCIDVQNPGELVVSGKAYDRTVAGIISGAGGLQTGMLMGQKSSIADGAHPVALTGRVYCKVDATTAAIEPGDLLTTSTTLGHAMKVLDYQMAQGAILGKAMTPLAQGEKGLVLVLVSLQ